MSHSANKTIMRGEPEVTSDRSLGIFLPRQWWHSQKKGKTRQNPLSSEMPSSPDGRLSSRQRLLVDLVDRD
jgi:hypothetical protein